jgi:hypothetical protein
MSTTSELEREAKAYARGRMDAQSAAAEKIDELERENARMREALFETHLDLVVYTDIEVARKRLVKRRAALAGTENG